jgi:hypothetical protein
MLLDGNVCSGMGSRYPSEYFLCRQYKCPSEYNHRKYNNKEVVVPSRQKKGNTEAQVYSEHAAR